MPRWEPDSRGRLEQAALDLYAERGFENATVAEIAARAGVTERTFFRYFADKREVLFGGSGALQELLVDAVAARRIPRRRSTWSPSPSRPPSVMFEARHDIARKRQAIIAASAELQERELIKLATLAAALADALRKRGTPAATATLTAEAGIAVFRVAFERWVEKGNRQDLAALMQASLDELKAVTAGK